MENKKEDYYSLGDLIKAMKSALFYLIKKWWILVISILFGAGLGLIYFFVQKPKYEAVSRFIVEEKTVGGGALSGLASQFGFDLSSFGGSGSSSLFSGDNILDILQSKNIVQKVLLSKVDSNSSKTLADVFLNFSDYKTKWQQNAALRNISFENSSKTLTPIQDSVLDIIYKRLLKKSISVNRVNKKGTLVEVSVTSRDRDFSRLFSTRMVEEAKELYINIKTSTALDNIKRLQSKADSLLSILNGKSYIAASTQVLDVNPGLRSAAVPTEIAMRDKTVVATLYAEVVKNLEASKMLFAQQTPIIQVIDSPSLALPDNKIEIPLCVFIFSGLSFFVTAGALLMIKIIQKNS